MLVLPQGPLHRKETNASLSIWGFGGGGGFFFQVFISMYMEVRGQLGRSQLSPFSIWVLGFKFGFQIWQQDLLLRVTSVILLKTVLPL